MNLIPNFWTILYPITYYFIGVYIFEYKIKINKIIGLLGIIVISLIEATITFVSSNSIGKGYNWIMDGYGGLLTVILSVLIFLELYTFNISNKMIKRFIESVSKCSLSIYLLSWIFDTVVYKVLNEKIATVPEKLPYYFVAVPLVFVSSYFVAFLVNWSYEFLSRIYKLYKKRKNSIA
jgi:surface polysaccharide O-acyltransferase-like enzyme